MEQEAAQELIDISTVTNVAKISVPVAKNCA